MDKNYKDKKNKQYSSFTDLAKDWDCKPYTRELKNKNKRAKIRDLFFSKHICKGCGSPMLWREGTNIAYCSNTDCKGIPHKLKDGTVIYESSYKILDEKSSSIARSINASYIEEKEYKHIMEKKEKKENGNKERND